MSLKRKAAASQMADEDSPATADGQDAAAISSAEADSGHRHRTPRSPEEIAAEVAEAVIWNYQGKDPEIALSGLAEFLEKKGQGDSDLAEVVAELRAILQRRLPPGRPIN